jgi:hypothetical protein
MAAVLVCRQPFFGSTAMVPLDRHHRRCCSDRPGGTNPHLHPRKKLSSTGRATESPQLRKLRKEVFQCARYSPTKTRTEAVPRKSCVLDRTIFQKPCPLQQYVPRVWEPPLAKQYALPHGSEGLACKVFIPSLFVDCFFILCCDFHGLLRCRRWLK